MRYLFRENNNIEKFNKVINKYIEIVELNNNKSSQVLMLVPNNAIKLKYQRNISLNFSEEINITTYIGFIKNELIKYWPIILNNCKKINKKIISPIFISNSLSEYIITDLVSEKREIEGYFQDLTGTNKNIANNIKNNIDKAAFNLIEFEDIGEKLYLSKKNRENLDRYSYTQMNEIINFYINKLLSNSMLDNSISVYLFNNYLMRDKIYLSNLQKKLKYVIVDSLENCSPAEVDFLDLISGYCKDMYMYFNPSRNYSSFNNVDMNYIEENIVNKIQDDSHSIRNVTLEDLYLKTPKIILNQSSQLYSEMIEELCEKIINLINNGEKSKSIAIITPVNNTILDYQVKMILNDYDINVYNTKKDKKFIDYTYANAIVTATCIFYDYLELIREEDYISFIQTIFNVNKIQAFKIFKNKEKDSNFIDILEYIKEKKESNLRINEFIMQFYIDKMLNLNEGKLNVKRCKNIIMESEVFTENINLLELDKKEEKEKIFIEALKTTINDFYGTNEIEELKERDGIILTTPYSYISSNMYRPIHIWVDIGSNSWNMKIEKDISNAVVLKKSFEEKKVYSDSIEESNKKYYLYNMIYNLLQNTQKIYAYKSEYSVNGYIQDSILNSLLLKLVNKGDNSYE